MPQPSPETASRHPLRHPDFEPNCYPLRTPARSADRALEGDKVEEVEGAPFSCRQGDSWQRESPAPAHACAHPRVRDFRALITISGLWQPTPIRMNMAPT